MSLDPEAARVAISEAETRSNERQIRQMRLLIVALIALTFIAAFSGAGFYLTYRQAHAVELATNRILDCSTPKGRCAKEQNQKIAAAIAALNAANAAGRKDVLTKVGQLVHLLGVPQPSIDKILAQPEQP
jgi:hypothetical protein